MHERAAGGIEAALRRVRAFARELERLMPSRCRCGPVVRSSVATGSAGPSARDRRGTDVVPAGNQRTLTSECTGPAAHDMHATARGVRSMPSTAVASTRTAAFVLGLFDTGLTVVRALAREGIPVYGFDAVRGPGLWSRYGTFTT